MFRSKEVSNSGKGKPGALRRRTAVAIFVLLTSAVLMFSYGMLKGDYMPHQFCFGGDKRLITANALADALTGLAYLAISVMLLWLTRRSGRSLPFASLFSLFGIFIVSCGAVHFLEIVTLWSAVYWLLTGIKVITAIASLVTAVAMLLFANGILEFVRGSADIATLRGNERFRAVVEATPMAVIGTDLDGKVISWNPSAERIFGWTKREILGTRAITAPDERKAELIGIFERSLKGETIRGFETERINRAGEIFPVSVSMAPLYNESHELAGVVATTEDIRERKRVEKELSEKSATLTAVTQALNAFLETGEWSTASQHLLSFALKQTQSEFGFLGVVLDGPVLRILSHAGVVWDENLNRELYESKTRQLEEEGYFELKHQHNLLGEVIYKAKTVVSNNPSGTWGTRGAPAGHPPMESFLGVPIFKGNEIVGLIAVANRAGGYTGGELRSLEEVAQATGVLYDNYRQSLKRAQLETQRARLESEFRQSQKMEVLGRLAGGVAHDFNNMLMILAGSAELLQQSIDENSTAGMYLGQIRRTVDKAAGITKQLLAFSRKQLLDVKPVDLHEVLTESEFLLPRLLGSDVELTFQHEALRSWIQGDTSALEQVIANLAINARDAMPGGGKLSIRTRNASQLPEDAHLTEGDSVLSDWLVVELQDSGSGMDDATRPHIFEPFFTTKPIGKGTGLGLSTVYGTVHQFKGHIHVESLPGAGSTFQLFFPVIASPLAASPVVARESANLVEAGKFTILLAEDETAIRQIVAEYLRGAGHRVYDSHSPQEVLEMARRHQGHIDVLLTDVVMPGLRGTELAQQVNELHPGIYIIYMSGYAPGFLDNPLPADAGFLQKPFRFATLAEQLKLVPRKI